MTGGSLLSFHIGELTFGPMETTLLALAVFAALWSAYNLWRIGVSEDRQLRIDALRSVVLRADRVVEAKRGTSLYDRLGALVAASPVVGIAEGKKLVEKLAAAGIKGSGRLATFVAVKVCAAVMGVAFALLLVEGRGYPTTARLTAMVIALVIGWRLPDFIVARLAAQRRVRVEIGMPDALDLLVICAEAGLSLEQSIEEVSRDLRSSSPEIADELYTTAAEMRVLPDRAIALENLGKRTGVQSLHSMIATLNQSMRFGTPLADSLRVIAAEMRNLRLARFEEQAARLPVLLTIPLMVFIVPCLFMVIGTPLVLRIIDVFSTVLIKGH